LSKQEIEINVAAQLKVEVRVPEGSTSGSRRVTTEDATSGVKREFYVQGDQIRHIQVQSSAMEGSGPFVVGGIVKHMSRRERQALLDAIREFDSNSLARR
jgi:hypothetical protein